jgi:hypothetical protein
MKKYFFGLIILYIFNFTSFAQDTQLLFKGKNQYLGQIEDNAFPVNLSFYYINKSKTNIKIISVKCSDELKGYDWNKNQSIAPGKSGKISFSYNGNRLGAFNQKIFIKTNEPGIKETELVFGGEVIPRKKTSADIYSNNNGEISFASNIINFGDIKSTQKKTDSLFFINNSNKTIMIEDYELNPAFAKIIIVTNDILPKAKGKIIVVYNATLRNAFGKTTDTIYFKTNEENNSLKAIFLQSDIYEDFSKIKPEKLKLAPKAYLINTNYDFKFVKKGEAVKTVFNIKNKGKTQLLIRKVDKTCECITVNYPEKIRFDRDSPIGISMDTHGLKGNIHETVTIITNDPENPRIVLHLMGIVE